MRWKGGPEQEPTAGLDPSLTLRTLCPTKALALHGLRFSYVICPPAMRDDLRYAYSNSMGPSSAFSAVLAARSMQVLLSDESNGKLLRHIRESYLALEREALFEDPSAA